MKACIVLISALSGTLLLSAENQETLKKLREHGGLATFDLTIKDEYHAPISDAIGNGWFWYKNNVTNDEACTDRNGKMTLSNQAQTDGGCTITKDGYYATEIYQSHFDVPDTPFGFFERRRWKPVVKEVVLKKKRNPIPMYSKQIRGPLPAINQPLGLDLKIMDWVKPYGKGEIVDVRVTVEAEHVQYGKTKFWDAKKVTFEWLGEYNGVQVCNADLWSELISSHHVNLNNPFQKRLTMRSKGGSDKWLDHKKYLVFRTRSKMSPTGILERCHYGKIYPTFHITSENFLLKVVFFNPTPNDTNLEFDLKNNLAPFSSFQEETMINQRWP